jgi:hypothetical protein
MSANSKDTRAGDPLQKITDVIHWRIALRWTIACVFVLLDRWLDLQIGVMSPIILFMHRRRAEFPFPRTGIAFLVALVFGMLAFMLAIGISAQSPAVSRALILMTMAIVVASACFVVVNDATAFFRAIRPTAKC